MEGFRLHDLKRWGREYADLNGGYSIRRTPQSCSQPEGSSLKITPDNPLFVWPIPQLGDSAQRKQPIATTNRP